MGCVFIYYHPYKGKRLHYTLFQSVLIFANITHTYKVKKQDIDRETEEQK